MEDDFWQITLDLLSQFAGGRNAWDYNIVPYGLGALFWGALLTVVIIRQKRRFRSRERLLAIGFSCGLGRELFMLLIVLLQAYGIIERDLLHVIFPPLEQALFDTAAVVVAAAFMNYLLEDKGLPRRYLQVSLILVWTCYFVSFWWWGQHIIQSPDSTFGKTWCDWLFRINASALLAFAIVILLQNTQGWVRNAACFGLACFFVSEYLKIPDMALNEVYEHIFTPVRQAIYLLGIPVFGYVYARELYEKHQQTENDLHESEKRYRTLFEEARDPSYITTQEGKFSDINDAGLALFGYSRQDLMTMNVVDLYVDSRARQHFQDEMERRGFVRDYEVHLRKKDGRQMICLLTANARYADDGNLLGYQGIIRDVTAQRRFEKQYRQTEKMEAMGTLAGGIAHDFNNILTAIIGYAYIAGRDLQQNSPTAKALKEIQTAGNRAKELIKQILTFSRRDEQEKKPLQIQLIIKEALKLLRATIPTTIEIRHEVKTTHGVITADPTQILQLLLNLSTNAVHAMKEKGILDIVIADVHLSEDEVAHQANLKAGDYVELIVRDTGCGMDPMTLSRIFDPFYTTKEIGEGTGMGLAVVHGIVKNHGGFIVVDSHPGEGASFKIYFPAAQKMTPEQEAFDETEFRGSERVLFVDDEKTIAKLGELTLGRFGYTVHSFVDSAEALALFKDDPFAFDLIITDQSMPKMSGYELALEALGIRPDIPIILCTGYTTAITREEAKQAGIREFVMKPIAELKLARVVRKVLDEQQMKSTG